MAREVRFVNNGLDPVDGLVLDQKMGRIQIENQEYSHYRFETGGVGANRLMQIKEEVYPCTASK